MQTTVNLPIPPGNFGLPFVGETLNFLRERNFAEKRNAKYGPIFRTHIFGRPTVFIMGAEANRFLLTNENKYFTIAWPKSIKMLLGSSTLSLQTGNLHASRRKLMYHAFQPRALASYIPTIEAITTLYLEKWESMKRLTWYPELRNYTLDIACKLFVGVDNGSKTQLGEFFEDWCAGLFTIAIPFPGTRFAKALRCRKELLKEIEQIILQRQQSSNLGEDALEILLQATDEAGNRLSLDELKDQILLLLFAGHETLTSALASFCLLMAQYPEILTRIRTEQEQFDLSGLLTLDTLKQMTYLEQVLKEVLRYISPVGGGFREVIQDCEFNGYLLPKGWSVQYNITKTHEDGHFYSNADRFDPDRFSSERAEDKQHFAYVPFGGGIRECLGKEFARLEMKIFATQLVRDYNWQLLPHQDLTLTTIPTPHPRDGLKIDFQKDEMRIIAYSYSDPLLNSPPDASIWGLEIDRVYQDFGDRLELQQLLTDCQTYPPNYLLIRRLEELGYTVAEISDRLNFLETLGVEIIATEHSSDFHSNLAKISEEIVKNQRNFCLKRGHARNRIKALPPPGKAPYGYRRGKDRYIIDKSTAPVVKEFFERFLLFGSLRGAVRYLEKRYGKKISVSTGKRWLTNPVYRGDLAYQNKEIIPDTHIPIISREEAAQIDRLLRRNCSLPPRTASAPRSLAGLVTCQSCQSAMTITQVTARGTKKEYLYLRPMNCQQNPKCKAILYQTVLEATINRICEDLPATVAQLNLPNLDSIKSKISQEIEQKKIILQIPTLQAQGILDEDTANLRIYKLRTEIAQLQAKLDQLPPGDLKIIVQAVSLPQFWLDLSESERRFYFREFIRKIEIIGISPKEWQLKLIFVF